MTAVISDRLGRLWNKVDAAEVRANSLSKGEARGASRTPPKPKQNSDTDEGPLPKNLNKMTDPWKCMECLQESDVTTYAKLCIEKGCPKQNQTFHTKCYREHVKIQHSQEEKTDSKPTSISGSSVDLTTSGERTLPCSGSSTDGVSSAGYPDADVSVNYESPKVEILPIGDIRTKAPPPLSKIATIPRQGGRQANGPEDERWTCRMCTEIMDKRHFVSCILCHQKQCKMCIENCTGCQKGPICPECIVQHALSCKEEQQQQINKTVNKVKDEAPTSADALVESLRQEAERYTIQESNSASRMMTEGRRLEKAVQEGKERKTCTERR